MGRSVDYASNASAVVYLTFDLADEWGDSEDWDDFVDNIREVLQRRFKSFVHQDGWVSRERRLILDNGFAEVQIAEYCGLVSVSLVPSEEYYPELGEAWCNQIADNFQKVLNEAFGGLRLLGRASNGEAFYERVA